MILGRWKVIFESLLTQIQIYREGYILLIKEFVCPTASNKTEGNPNNELLHRLL